MNTKTIEAFETNYYNRHGCNIKGDLIVFEYFHLVNTGTGGNANFHEFVEKIEKFIEEKNLKGECVLHVPDYVFRRSK